MFWFLKALQKYADFEGRARRKEYWFFQLFKNLIIFAFLFIVSLFGTVGEDAESLLLLIGFGYYLFMYLPSLAVTVRRLNDTGRSGWWYLIILVPFLGWIILLIFLLADSQPGENEYGPNPKEVENSAGTWNDLLSLKGYFSRRHSRWFIIAMAIVCLGIIFICIASINPLIYAYPALMISRGVGNRAWEADNLNSIGVIYRESEQYSQALSYYNQALVIRRDVGDRAGEGNVLNNIGIAHFYQGDYDQALDTFNQALVISREVGDGARECNLLIGIGSALQGQPDQALNSYNLALEKCREVGNRYGEGEALYNIGNLYKNQGQPDLAQDYFNQALVIVQEVDAKDLERRILYGLESLSNR